MKQRLDVLLTENGYAPSREKAKLLIMEGLVYVNGDKEDKPGTQFDPLKAKIEVRGKPLPYVSRGGLKLEKALKVFPIELAGKTCLDIGASTGGFTDCMLQGGAALVYAVDVGYGQLDWKLREDPRVVCMEKTNFRYLTREELTLAGGGRDREGTENAGPVPDFASCDVSFISLSKILPPAFDILREGGEMVTLIKPQFEAGREKVGRKGVVRDPKVHEEVIRAVSDTALATGFEILGIDFSPIRGPEGNIEYLLYLKKPGKTAAREEAESGAGDGAHDISVSGITLTDEKIHQLVEDSHRAFS